MNILTLDLETTTKKVHSRTANFKYNNIVAIGLKYYNPELTEQDLGRLTGHYGLYTNEFPKNWLNYVDMLVGHNIKFDLLYIWNREDLQEWFKNGGVIWDTGLAHYILSGQTEKYPALRDIATRCYGCGQREKKMEAYWERGIDTKYIPKELVVEDVKNDVADTETIFFQQVVRAKSKGMMNLIQLQMDALLATTEIEYNGMFINKEIFNKNKVIIGAELEKKKQEFLTLIKDYWVEE